MFFKHVIPRHDYFLKYSSHGHSSENENEPSLVKYGFCVKMFYPIYNSILFIISQVKPITLFFFNKFVLNRIVVAIIIGIILISRSGSLPRSRKISASFNCVKFRDLCFYQRRN